MSLRNGLLMVVMSLLENKRWVKASHEIPNKVSNDDLAFFMRWILKANPAHFLYEYHVFARRSNPRGKSEEVKTRSTQRFQTYL